MILADQVLELRMRGRQIHALRKSKATDPYTRLEDLAKQVPADDILGQQIVNGIRISDAEIEALRHRGYEGELVEAIETFLSDLLL